MGGVKVGSQMEATVQFMSDDNKVKVASCFGVGSLVTKELVGPWKVPEGVKMTSAVYVAVLDDHLEPWFKFKSLSLKRKLIFMHGNAPSRMQRRQLHNEDRFQN